MTKLSPWQIEILRDLNKRYVLLFEEGRPSRGGGWRWVGGAKADGWACRGLWHRSAPLISVEAGPATNPAVGLRLVSLTDAGRAALAAAKEGT